MGAKKVSYVCPICGSDMKTDASTINDIHCKSCNIYWTPRNLLMSYTKRLKLIETAIGKHTYGGGS